MAKKQDLGIKVLPKEEAYWTNVVEKTKAEIETLTNMLKFNNFILENAQIRIERERKQDLPLIEED